MNISNYYTHDNTEGYTDEQLVVMNAEFEQKAREILDANEIDDYCCEDELRHLGEQIQQYFPKVGDRVALSSGVDGELTEIGMDDLGYNPVYTVRITKADGREVEVESRHVFVLARK